MSIRPTLSSRLRRGVAAGALALAALFAPVAAVAADPAASTAAVSVAAVHGPTPDASSITVNGPYSYGSVRVGYGTAGSAGGTIYYPTNAAPGETFGGVVTIPGYMEPGTVMNVYGPRLASHGFVVMVANSYMYFDDPTRRATAARAALKALAANPTVAGLLDPTRMALVGHSMGGGGVLTAAEQIDLKAVIAVHPWAQRGFAGVTEPTLVIGGGIDNIAPLDSYTVPIYQSLTSATFKELVIKQAGTHWAGTVDDPQLQSRNLAFLKVFVDGDERYRPFLCAPAQAGTIVRSTC